jgi:hypothetical protein
MIINAFFNCIFLVVNIFFLLGIYDLVNYIKKKFSQNTTTSPIDIDLSTKILYGLISITLFLKLYLLFNSLSLIFASIVFVIFTLVGLRNLISLDLTKFKLISFSILVLMLLTINSSFPNSNYDSATYQFPLLTWFDRFQILNGMANFNSFFSLINISPILASYYNAFDLPIYSHTILNSTLMMCLLIDSFSSIRQAKLFDFIYIFRYSIIIVSLLFINFSPNYWYASMSSDLPVLILLMWFTVIFFENKSLNNRLLNDKAILILIFVAEFRYNLSLFIFSYWILLFFKGDRARLPLMKLFVFNSLVWFYIKYTITGFPFSPFTFVEFRNLWNVDSETLEAISHSIKWTMRLTYSKGDIENHNWVNSYFVNFFRDKIVLLSIFILLIVFILHLSYRIIFGSIPKLSIRLHNIKYFLIVYIPNVFFWFQFSPDLRYGWFYLIIFPIILFSSILFQIFIAMDLVRSFKHIFLTIFAFTFLILSIFVQYTRLVKVRELESFNVDTSQSMIPYPSYSNIHFNNLEINISDKDYCFRIPAPCLDTSSFENIIKLNFYYASLMLRNKF